MRNLSFRGFPAFVDPEPVGGIAADRRFQHRVNVAGDILDRPAASIYGRGNRRAVLEAPFAEARAKTNGHMQRAAISQRKNRRGGGDRAIMAQKGQPQSLGTRVLVGEQPDH